MSSYKIVIHFQDYYSRDRVDVVASVYKDCCVLEYVTNTSNTTSKLVEDFLYNNYENPFIYSFSNPRMFSIIIDDSTHILLEKIDFECFT